MEARIGDPNYFGVWQSTGDVFEVMVLPHDSYGSFRLREKEVVDKQPEEPVIDKYNGYPEDLLQYSNGWRAGDKVWFLDKPAEVVPKYRNNEFNHWPWAVIIQVEEAENVVTIAHEEMLTSRQE